LLEQLADLPKAEVDALIRAMAAARCFHGRRHKTPPALVWSG
jgi:hypothetical protein